MAADTQARAQELERFRPYLDLQVRLLTNRQFQGKIDLSGVVQVTMLKVWQAWEEFEQLKKDDEKETWLRTRLLHNLLDMIDYVQADRRNVGRERPLEATAEDSSARPEVILQSDESSPSQKAIRNEERLRVREALGQLSKERQEALMLHFFLGLTLVETAERLGKTKDAVAKLVQRGLADLRERLAGDKAG